MTKFVVPPRSWDDIAAVTVSLRQRFGLAEVPDFPIMELIELVLDHKLHWLHFLVGSRGEMREAEGLTDPTGKFIMLREDVNAAAWAGNGRGRFTAAHELGHWVMHTNVPMARVQLSAQHGPYELAEPQANQFAAELLMPRDFIDGADTAASIARRHGVSTDAASKRLIYLRKKGLKPS